jgi:hypothetical protein
VQRVASWWLAALVGVASAGAAQAQVVYGLTSAGSLVQFNSSTPGTLIGSPVSVSGLTGGDALVGIDHRPADGSLVGLGYNSSAGTARVYTINPSSGAATQINSITVGTGVTAFGVDFNPVPNAFRIVTNTNANLRVPAGGTAALATDTPLNPGTPNIQAVAYTNNFNGATVTTLYGIDAASGNLVTIGGLNGNPSPNFGALSVIAALTGATASQITGFDVAGSTGTAFLTNGTSLFSLNLATGAAASLGNLPAGIGAITDITAVPEPGTLALCGLAVTGLAGYRRLRRKTAAPVNQG